MGRVLDMTVCLNGPEAGEANLGFHWVKIGMSTAPGGYTTLLLWRMLPTALVNKWRWYFDYRAALMKAQNPRMYVSIQCGFEQNVDTQLYAFTRLTKRLRSKKAKVTEWQNRLACLKEHWQSLFPIEDDPDWIRAQQMLREKQEQLQTMQQEYELQKEQLEKRG